MFAPHPDDESLACGILLQTAVQAGTAISVVYITDGENNPWPQRCLSRRWRLNSADRHKWAKLRRKEALAALRVLGAAPADARFLGWPDQGLAGLLLSDRASSLARLRHLIFEWSPTDVVAPDVADRHRDHSALGAMLGLLFSDRGSDLHQIQRWTYIVHGRDPRFLRNARPVPQTQRQVETKRRAISCHQTQLMLSRRRFLGYAARPELLLDIPPQEVAQEDCARASVIRRPGKAQMAALHDGIGRAGTSLETSNSIRLENRQPGSLAAVGPGEEVYWPLLGPSGKLRTPETLRFLPTRRNRGTGIKRERPEALARAMTLQ